MVELVEERLCHALCLAFPQTSLKELLVFDKSVDVVLSSVFARGNLEHKRYTEQGLLGVTVRHHLQGDNVKQVTGETGSRKVCLIFVKRIV